MKIWKYGVVIIDRYREPELFKRFILKGSAIRYAITVTKKLRSEGLRLVEVEVWSREKIEEHNVMKLNRTLESNIKVVE